MAKYWAYTNALLGQVDASIVADIPAYGVFRDASTSEFVAYNPTNQPITAHFKQLATGNAVKTLPVPAQSIVSESSAGGRAVTFKPSQITTPSRPALSRAYHRPHASANDRPTQQHAGHLAAT